MRSCVCVIPFAFAPVLVTVACFALGGLIYGSLRACETMRNRLSG